MTENLAGALCYIGWFVTGILFLVLAPYNQSRTVKFHAFQSIFASIAWAIVLVALGIIGRIIYFVPVLGGLLMGLIYFVLGIAGFLLWLFMMFKTYNNEKIVLPVIGPLAEKQANA